jgi:hypothetical protein
MEHIRAKDEELLALRDGSQQSTSVEAVYLDFKG